MDSRRLRPNGRWSMDFMGDTLANGRTFRTLNIVDDASRECLVIEVDTSLSGYRARGLDAFPGRGRWGRAKRSARPPPGQPGRRQASSTVFLRDPSIAHDTAARE
jgi:transposase InsO family protein